MKKIAIDCRCFVSMNGVSRYLENILDNLFVKDIENKYFLIAPKNYKVLEKYKKYDNVTVANFNVFSDIVYKFFLIRKFIQKNNINIYWSPTQDNLLFKIDNCITIITIHDIAFEHYKNWFGFKVQILSYLGLYKRFFLNSNFVFYISKFTKSDAEKTYGIAKDNIITYNGASEVFKEINKDVAREYVSKKFHFNKKFIFYIDTVRYENLFNAFKLFLKENDDVDLVCLGSFAGNNILNYARNIEIENNIKWINYRVSDLDLNNLYSAAEFFISPSYYEGFGLTPLESIQSGTPIVVSNLTSLPEIFEGSALFFNPDDIRDIHDQMKLLINNDPLKKDLLNKSKHLIDKYDWKNISNNILKVFNNIY